MRLILGFVLFFCVNAYAKEFQFDFPEVQVGQAVNPAGPTGVTVFYFPKGAQAAIDIRGGSVGTFFTQEKMQEGEAYLDAIAFAGGGILGMEAFAGIVSSLFEREKGAAFNKMPLVSGAVIFDYTPRNNSVYPDKALGQKALLNVKPGRFLQGAEGVGVSASMGKRIYDFKYIPSGQGAAFAQVGNTKIAVFTVVNAVGVVLDEKGQPLYKAKKTSLVPVREDTNTTLTLVVINQKLSARHLKQLGRQVHHALSQVIQPYATILDGDVLYTVSTNSVVSDLYRPGEKIYADLNFELIKLGVVAGEVAKKAVWAAVGKEN